MSTEKINLSLKNALSNILLVIKIIFIINCNYFFVNDI